VTPADAAGFTVLPGDQSSLSFVYRQMGVPVEGRFTKYSARITFDPAEPAAAKASLELDLTSADAGSAEANDELAARHGSTPRHFPRRPSSRNASRHSAAAASR